MMKLVILVSMLVVPHYWGTPNLLKRLKEKAKTMQGDVQVVVESRQGASLTFVPRNDILYPGLDQDKVATVRKLWQDYYDCQRALHQATLRLVVPTAVAVPLGSHVVLECEVCQSPRDMFADTKWLFAADYNMKYAKEIKLTSSAYIKNDSLIMTSAVSGLYVCQKGNHTARPYILHIFEDELSKQVVPEMNTEGEHPAADIPLPELELTLTTHWGAWTECNRCDQIGLKHRQGICTIISNKNLESLRDKRKTFKRLPIVRNLTKPFNNLTYRHTFPPFSAITMKATPEPYRENTTNNLTSVGLLNTTESTTLYNITTEAPRNVSMKDDLDLIEMFEEGIPCRSKLISTNIRDLGPVSNRSSEVLVAYCKLACPKSVLFVVMDEKGNVIEEANNSAGIYSMKQGLPKVIPSMKSTVEFAKYNQFFRIQCPGNRDAAVPVQWYVGKKALTNKVLKNETAGRIKIDEYNRIIFNPALIQDSRVFSCWQRDKLAGTVRLIVEKVYNLNYEKPVLIVGVSILFGVFAMIFYKLYIKV